jgi:toxin FitB
VKFVLDTNAVSELVKLRSNDAFLEWHDSQNPADLFVTTATLGEVWQGLHRLAPNHRDFERIKKFASELANNYRLLNFDARAAVIWGKSLEKPRVRCQCGILLSRRLPARAVFGS